MLVQDFAEHAGRAQRQGRHSGGCSSLSEPHILCGTIQQDTDLRQEQYTSTLCELNDPWANM